MAGLNISYLINKLLGVQIKGSDVNLPVQLTGSSVKKDQPVLTRESNGGSSLYPISKLTELNIPTYDGSGQTVHPSVVYIPAGFGGYKYWMAHTPYPFGNDDIENPSIVASNDAKTWVTPAGLTNPIDQPTAGEITAGGHLSDVELIYDGTQLILYYRYQASSAAGILVRRISSNGVAWSAKTNCTISDNRDPISPAIVRINASSWEMWLGGTNNLIRYTSTDGIAWTNFKLCTSNISLTNFTWHPFVWIGEAGYHALVSCYSKNKGNGNTRLFYAKSVDGLDWLFDESPAIYPSDASFVERQVYRSCALMQGDELLIFVSGANEANQWKIGSVEMKMESFKKIGIANHNIPETRPIPTKPMTSNFSTDYLPTTLVATGQTVTIGTIELKGTRLGVACRLAGGGNKFKVTVTPKAVGGTTVGQDTTIIDQSTTATWAKDASYLPNTRFVEIKVVNSDTVDFTVTALTLTDYLN